MIIKLSTKTTKTNKFNNHNNKKLSPFTNQLKISPTLNSGVRNKDSLYTSYILMYIDQKYSISLKSLKWGKSISLKVSRSKL